MITNMGLLGVDAEWLSAITAWEMFMRAASRPETTIYLRTYHLRRLAADHAGSCPWALTFDALIAWLGLHTSWAVETRRAYRASIRSFYAWGVLAGHLCGTSPAALLPPIRPPRGKPRPASDRILADALIGADDRERLMVMLAGYAGLRRGEISRVHTADLEEDLTGWSLRVHGKGGHTRVVPLTGALSLALRALPEGWAFPGLDGGHLTPAHVGKIVSRRMPPGWTAHTLRHRFATTLRSRDVQLDVIRELLGHARVETTLIYSEVPSGALRAAVMAAA
jgi:integrase